IRPGLGQRRAGSSRILSGWACCSILRPGGVNWGGAEYRPHVPLPQLRVAAGPAAGEATIEGLEQAWASFQGGPKRLILDNFPAAVVGTDPLNPRPTRAFVEYSQARGLLLDPARVRRPRDTPQIERLVHDARGRFWKGGTFIDLADARRQAGPWCLEAAGPRVHGTTRKRPVVVFEDEERRHLLTDDGIPSDVPLWRDVTVHPDHHVS